MRSAGAFRIAPEHPCLAGHFPGQPVVPGVVLLDELFACIGAALGSTSPTTSPSRVAQVKFLRPVRPDQPVEVFFAGDGQGRVSFEGLVGGTPVLRGRATIE